MHTSTKMKAVTRLTRQTTCTSAVMRSVLPTCSSVVTSSSVFFSCRAGMLKNVLLPANNCQHSPPFCGGCAPSRSRAFGVKRLLALQSTQLWLSVQACKLGPWSSARQLVEAREAAADARKERLASAAAGTSGASLTTKEIDQTHATVGLCCFSLIKSSGACRYGHRLDTNTEGLGDAADPWSLCCSASVAALLHCRRQPHRQCRDSAWPAAALHGAPLWPPPVCCNMLLLSQLGMSRNSAWLKTDW